MRHGHQLFADDLTRLAADISDPRLSAIAAAITAPPLVSVSGRRGVGRRSVAAALTAAGVSVAGLSGRSGAGEIAVHVVAEVVKPEDVAAVQVAAAMQTPRRRPVLVVLNKADLSGRCDAAAVAAALRAPAEPMSALFALAALDDRPGAGLDRQLWAALRALAAQPADLSSAERFVGCPHPLPQQVRERLCTSLDLSGIDRMLDPARRGGTAAQARALLRRLSGVDGVVARLTALSAGLHYQRMSEAVARLEAMAVGEDSAARIDAFLNCDSTVTARMIAAADAVQEQRVPDEPALRRARRWQAYRSAPVGFAGRACAADITRGSLRAWASARSSP